MPHCGFVLSIFYEGPYEKLLENTSVFCLPGHLYYFRILYEEITDFNVVNEYLRLSIRLSQTCESDSGYIYVPVLPPPLGRFSSACW